MFELEKNTDFEHKNRVLEPIRTAWLAIANEVRTRIIRLGKNILSLINLLYRTTYYLSNK